jgi:hypothetical protein
MVALDHQGVLLFGKWHLFVSSGAFGGKETIGVLKTWKEPWKRLFLCSNILCIVGLRLMSIICLFLFLTFSLAFLFLVRCFPCILPVYQGAPYAFLINLISYLPKKKKIIVLMVASFKMCLIRIQHFLKLVVQKGLHLEVM